METTPNTAVRAVAKAWAKRATAREKLVEADRELAKRIEEARAAGATWAAIATEVDTSIESVRAIAGRAAGAVSRTNPGGTRAPAERLPGVTIPELADALGVSRQRILQRLHAGEYGDEGAGWQRGPRRSIWIQHPDAVQAVQDD